MQGTIEIDDWRVTTRKNRAGNLTLEVYLGDDMHAEIILQKNGTLDLGTKARPWPLGQKGWDMPGAVKTCVSSALDRPSPGGRGRISPGFAPHLFPRSPHRCAELT